jgi:hypothetical protein
MPATENTAAKAEDLPVHDGDTPPENQHRGRATEDDLAERGDA